MMMQLMAVTGLPLVLCFIIVFMPFVGKHDDKHNVDVSVDNVDVDITKLIKLLDKEAAERRATKVQSRFKYIMAGYREG